MDGVIDKFGLKLIDFVLAVFLLGEGLLLGLLIFLDALRLLDRFNFELLDVLLLTLQQIIVQRTVHDLQEVVTVVDTCQQTRATLWRLLLGTVLHSVIILCMKYGPLAVPIMLRRGALGGRAYKYRGQI
jgi:hypothetical protein